MCGISGIIQRNNQRVDLLQLKAMNDLVAHRGPDGEGFYHGDNFAFGHRRLAIIDLSEGGKQPMSYEDKFVITFNGEIYNYLEIKKELIELGYKFHSDSDTEVILAAYKCWGEECVIRFNGMWAFAIFDKERKIIFCSRDRFGIKPFYFACLNDQFVFGSEIKQILDLKKESTANLKIVLDYLIIGFEEHTNETFFEGVSKLPGSHNLIYNLADHSFSIQPYYHIEINASVGKMTEEFSVQEYRRSFDKSMELRLRSDVNVGTCLSGGLDSSSVAAIGSKEYRKTADQKFIAIHAKSSEKDTDESEQAKKVAEFCDLNLNIIEPTDVNFIQSINEVIYTQEEPFGSPSVFMQYFVLKKARELNCIVMLDGQGGDETLLGYEKYYPAYLMSLKGLKKWKGFFNASKNSKLSLKQVIFYFFYFTNYKLRLNRLKKKNRFIKPEYLKTFHSKELKQMANSYSDIKKLQLFEISKTQLPHLLKYEDKNSMRNSIETRLPFLDYKVLQTALSINNEFKIKEGWTKFVLRKAIEKELPDSIIWRKNKLGFNAPEKTWLGQIDDEMRTDVFESPILNRVIDFKKLNWSNLDLRLKWRLFNLARWQKIYDVK